MRRHWIRIVFLLAIGISTTHGMPEAQADEAKLFDNVARENIRQVEVFPKRIEFSQPFADVQLLITAWLDDGQQFDVTRLAKLESPATHIQLSDTRSVTPVSDGQETLHFSIGTHHVDVPVSVQGMQSTVDVSFVQHVQPALSKMGCNAGTCHGAKDGQRGFKLSLRGYDYLFDHRALTDDIGARRFNRANPDQSLMLLKSSGSIPHVGGALTQPGQRRYELLKRWIRDGAKLDLESPRVASIKLLPQDPILPRAKMNQQMVVMATYEDGSTRDVTSDTFVESGNIEILSADKQGLVSTLRRGEAPVLARYEGAYTATTITIMGDRSEFQWQPLPENNYVDELVYQKLQRVKILPSPLCTDDEFIRRVYLDLTGLPPSPDQVRAFLADPSPIQQKRDALVDRLVGGHEFVELWTNKWADLLQVNRKYLGKVGAAALRDWIKDAVATNKPYDQFAYEVLTGSGSTLDNPAAAYWKILRDPAQAMENTTHLFLAVRFNCNKCHDHPFERWTQNQYYNLTAYFAQVGRKGHPDYAGQRIGGSAVESAVPLVEVVFDKNDGEVKHDLTGQIAAPSFPFQHDYDGQSAQTRREELANWIVSPENRYFASSYVNRLWGYLLGVGLIEPIDDIRAGNPPTNPELLAALTKDFIDSGFDMQHMMRRICKSRVYQHSVQTNRWNEDDGINYSHAIPRRLPAEVLYDTIHAATGSKPRIAGVPEGFRAAELPDVGIKVDFLDDFGRPARESSCECERSSGIVLGPIMKLINGPTVNDAITDQHNTLSQLAEEIDDDRKLVEELFLRFLSRRPTDAEVKVGLESLSAARHDDQAIQARLTGRRQTLMAGFPHWLSNQTKTPHWTVLRPASMHSDAEASFQVEDNGTILVEGNLSKDTYHLEVDLPTTTVTGLRLETLTNDKLPAGGPGRAPNGNFVLSELSAAIEIEDDEQPRPLKLQAAQATHHQSEFDAGDAIDGNDQTGWAIAPRFNQPHTLTVETSDAPTVEHARLIIQLRQNYGDGQHALGSFRISITDDPSPLAGSDLPDKIAELASMTAAERNDAQQQALVDYFLQLDADYRQLQKSLELARQQAAQYRLTGVQDLAWALINNPAFLFNR